MMVQSPDLYVAISCLDIPEPSYASPDCMETSIFFDGYAVSPQITKAFDPCVYEFGYRLKEQCHHLVCKIDESQHALLRVLSSPWLHRFL